MPWWADQTQGPRRGPCHDCIDCPEGRPHSMAGDVKRSGRDHRIGFNVPAAGRGEAPDGLQVGRIMDEFELCRLSRLKRPTVELQCNRLARQHILEKPQPLGRLWMIAGQVFKKDRIGKEQRTFGLGYIVNRTNPLKKT